MDPETQTPENAQNQADSASTPTEQNQSQPQSTSASEVVDVATQPEQTAPVASVIGETKLENTIPVDQMESNAVVGASQGGFNSNDLGIRRFAIAVVVLLVLGVLWYFSNQQMQKLRNVPFEESGVTINVSDKQEEGTVTIVEQSSQTINSSTSGVVSANMTVIKAYYLNTEDNPNLKDCSKVMPLEKQTERKYTSQIINTMRGLLEPLTAEQQSAGWSSAIPAGVLLKSVMIRDGGVAEANFTGNLKRVAGSCAVTAVRAQIEQTLKQFPGVKSVRICIDGNCNQSQILQP